MAAFGLMLGSCYLAGGLEMFLHPQSAIFVIVGAIACGFMGGDFGRFVEQALTYITWLFIAEGTAVLYILLPRMQRLKAQSQRQLLLAFIGGLLSALAYGLALYAKTKAPLGVVSALRETSVIIAAMIGVFWFGEGPVKTRLCAAAVVMAGIVMLALA